jgi:hypothetical protein
MADALFSPYPDLATLPNEGYLVQRVRGFLVMQDVTPIRLAPPLP